MPSLPHERIAIVGGGIAGLACALALGGRGARVVLFERDDPAQRADPEEAFLQWKRPGVTHLRHSHVFLARLYNLIRDRYPDLLQQLLEAGCRELRFEDGLPPALKEQYEPAPQDADFTILSSRRTTLELVMRRYVEELGQVEMRAGVRVDAVLLDTDEGDVPAVRGLRWNSTQATTPAPSLDEVFDVVIDATGKRSPFPAWLRTAGVVLEEECAPAGILYLTRHYRLLPGRQEPDRGHLPGNGDLGFFKFGVFPADNGNFSVTVALPENEVELRIAVKKPEGFDAACLACPGVARWIESDRAEATSKVYGMGGLESRWVSYSRQGQPSVLHFFAVGDSIIRSNPLYGRGCSSGALQAHLLADILFSTRDPAQRAGLYAEALRREIRPHYDSMARQDRQAIRRASGDRDSTKRHSWKQRLKRSFVEDGVLVASRGSLTVLRALMRGFHMLEDPALAVRDPKIVLHILSFWLRPERAKRHLRLPKLGPSREEMIRLLGIEEAAGTGRAA